MFINIIWFLRHTKLKTKALSSKENKWQNLGKGTSIYVFLKSDAHMNSTHILKKPLISHFAYTSALCSLPHWKVSIRDLRALIFSDKIFGCQSLFSFTFKVYLGPISPFPPIFLCFSYFRQNINALCDWNSKDQLNVALKSDSKYFGWLKQVNNIWQIFAP